MKALVGAFNQEKALVGAFSVIVQPVVEPMEHYTALEPGDDGAEGEAGPPAGAEVLDCDPRVSCSDLAAPLQQGGHPGLQHAGCHLVTSLQAALHD